MHRSWTLLAITLRAAISYAALVGVGPDKTALYVPVSGSNPPTWKCLNDSSRVIPFTALNDDYCDCPDGSDEPGTSACPNSSFYCNNAGHIGAYIKGASVNDGLCEPSCCDGSDEPAGVCPNICKQVGEEYRKQNEALLKIRKTGAKIRGTYVAFAQKEKAKLEDSIEQLKKDIVLQEKELTRLEDVLERSESVSHAAMTHKKQSPLYQELLTHSRALKTLQQYHRDLQEREKTLADILATLKTSYNPNYQDMGVLEAVRGWDAYNGEETTETPQDGDDIVPVTTEAEGETVERLDGEWTEDEIDYKIDQLVGHDYENLLIQHEEHVGHLNEDVDSELFDLGAYIPEALADKYDAFRESAVGFLSKVGVVRKVQVDNSAAEATNTARQERDTARSKLDESKRKKSNEEDELKKLFDATHYGRDGEWRKLKDTCLTKDTGEYIYEVCLFGSANQKSKNGGSNFLGKFSGWNDADGVEKGSPEYYSVQKYTSGARCWNGPERSVTLKLECGTENTLFAVSEPEKCEYHITGTSAALCLPVNKDGQHEEL